MEKWNDELKVICVTLIPNLYAVVFVIVKNLHTGLSIILWKKNYTLAYFLKEYFFL